MQQRRNLVDPRVHVHTPAAGDGNDGVLISSADGADQLVLSLREREGAVHALAFCCSIETHGDERLISHGGDFVVLGHVVKFESTQSWKEA